MQTRPSTACEIGERVNTWPVHAECEEGGSDAPQPGRARQAGHAHGAHEHARIIHAEPRPHKKAADRKKLTTQLADGTIQEAAHAGVRASICGWRTSQSGGEK